MLLNLRVFKKMTIIYSLRGYYQSHLFLALCYMSISFYFYFTMSSHGLNHQNPTVQHLVPPGKSVQYDQDENWYFKTVTSTWFYLYCKLLEQKL